MSPRSYKSFVGKDSRNNLVLPVALLRKLKYKVCKPVEVVHRTTFHPQTAYITRSGGKEPQQLPDITTSSDFLTSHGYIVEMVSRNVKHKGRRFQISMVRGRARMYSRLLQC